MRRAVLPWIFLGTSILFIIINLILWLLGVPLFQPKAMELKMPPPQTEILAPPPGLKEDKVLTLILGKEDQIYYYEGVPDQDEVPHQTDYSPQGIRNVIQEHRQSQPDPIVVIKPSEESRYQNMVDILDEMSISEVKKYALTDITPVDSLLMENLKQDE